MAAWKQGLEPMTSPSPLPRLNSVSGRLYGALGVGWGDPLWMGLFYVAGSFVPLPLVETAAQQQMFTQGPCSAVFTANPHLLGLPAESRRPGVYDQLNQIN